jgi:hypothetical protein
LDVLVADVAELADALDSKSYYGLWTPLETLGQQSPNLDIKNFKLALFGRFWPAF